MIVIEQKITRKGLDFSAKTWRAMGKKAWQRLGEYWHQRILPKHFTHAGAREYGYAPREGEGGRSTKEYVNRKGQAFHYQSYTRRKQRRFGHTLPLVFTGDLRREVTRNQDIRATSKGVTIVLHGPRYMYQYRGGGPDKAAELQAVSMRDETELTRRMDIFMQAEIVRTDRAGGFRDVRQARA